MTISVKPDAGPGTSGAIAKPDAGDRAFVAANAELRAGPETKAQAEQRRIMLHMPVDVRSASLAILAALAAIFMLRWAAAVLIPIMLGVMISYALSPLVDRMERWHLPRSLGAGVLLLAIVGGLGSTAYSLSDEAALLAQSLPDATRKLQQAITSRVSTKESTIDIVQRAAQQLEQAAMESNSTAVRGVQRVQIERPRFNIKDYLWSGTMGLMNFLGQTVMVMFIAFFLLVSGNTFRRKMVKLAGPRLSQKKITVQALDEITGQIQRYLLVQVFTSIVVGVATWLVFVAMGLEQAAVWGVLAAVFNLIPYVGAIVVTGGAALVGFLQFGTLEMALAIGAASMIIQSIEGYLLTPWLTSRASRMNPVVIFVGVLVWGWLWGVWGLLLGVPIMMVIKAVCDRIEDLKPVAELLEA
ncbi:AI-2E family transporter [soil metagenome]